MKPEAAELLERELSAPGYSPKVIAIGTNTDPYQPIERRYKVMRRILEVLERAGHPVGIVTKSALVLRDLDILARMAERKLAKVALSVTTLDPELARKMEPRAATPMRRLETLRRLAQVGVPTTVMVAPVIPALNDMEIERILDAAQAAGVKEAGYVLLRLPLEVRDLFREWLMANYPDRYRHVFKLIRETRGGKDYDSTWGKRMKGTGPYAWMIGRRFEMACEKLGLNASKVSLSTAHFRAPKPATEQLSSSSVVVKAGLSRSSTMPASATWCPDDIDFALHRRESHDKPCVARVMPPGRKSKPSQRLPLNEPVLRPTFRRERRALNKGIFPVAGCDEAGRGPLAGPVVAAAVILDPKRIPRGLNDSKKLDAPSARSCTRKSAPRRRWRWRSARSSASTATTSCAPRSGRWRAR